MKTTTIKAMTTAQIRTEVRKLEGEILVCSTERGREYAQARIFALCDELGRRDED